jgi:thiosulfate/3-mercaptopyruvate sulfurtransferase
MTGPLVDHPLVSTQWLADHLGADDLLVFDASVLGFAHVDGRPGYLTGHERYVLEGHIPGAVFADLIEEFSDPEGTHPFTRPDAARFTAAASALGIGATTTVVVYDSAVGQWAARLWWLLRSFGHERVAVLDGGYSRWAAEQRATDIGHIEPVAAAFSAREQPGFWVEKADVEAILAGEERGALVCGLPPRDFAAEHIPGSVSAPAGRLVDADTNTVLPLERLRESLGPVLDSERIVAYCRGGIAAAADALALTLLGHQRVAIYDGSLNEWSADPLAPLVRPAVA